MKLIDKYLILLCVFVCCSCNYLDIVPDEKPTEEDAFKNPQLTERYLYSCYSYIPDPRDGSYSLDLMTGDDVVTPWEHETFGKFADDEDGKNWLRLPDAEIDIFVGNQLSSVEIMPENMEIRTVAKSIDEEISRDIAENEKKKAENADKDGEFLNGFGVDPEEPDTNFYKPEDDATENVSPEEESENVDQ